MKINSKMKGFILFYAVGLAAIYVCTLRVDVLNNMPIEETKIVYNATE